MRVSYFLFSWVFSDSFCDCFLFSLDFIPYLCYNTRERGKSGGKNEEKERGQGWGQHKGKGERRPEQMDHSYRAENRKDTVLPVCAAIALPACAEHAIHQLESAGFETWVVGGCVRDALRGQPPADWDICTQATPAQMQTIFAEEKVIPTGLKHGTLTVLLAGQTVEMTTFRAEGAYSDGRHPDQVQFVQYIQADLARRDFTVNAMAWHPVRGLYDPFSGWTDLQQSILRAVGDPDTRFTEDALRILRAIRFVAQTGWTVEEQTAAAMRRQKHRLACISAERIQQECTKMLCNRYAYRALRDFADIITSVLPELAPMVGCQQCNPHHLYDVWEHSIQAVGQIPATPVLRWAALLHDCGKPACKTLDAEGVGHFYQHARQSGVLAAHILKRLRFSNEDSKTIVLLVEQHDPPLGETEKRVRRRLAQLGEAHFRELLMLKKADAVGQGTGSGKITSLCCTERLLEQILDQQACFSLRQLAVNGHDMMALGMSGKAIGEMLQRLLDRVIQEQLPNERMALLDFVRRQCDKKKEELI